MPHDQALPWIVALIHRELNPYGTYEANVKVSELLHSGNVVDDEDLLFRGDE